MNYSIIEGCIRQSMDRPIDNKQIVVKEKNTRIEKDSLWVVKSHHAENINLLTQKNS